MLACFDERPLLQVDLGEVEVGQAVIGIHVEDSLQRLRCGGELLAREAEQADLRVVVELELLRRRGQR